MEKLAQQEEKKAEKRASQADKKKKKPQADKVCFFVSLPMRNNSGGSITPWSVRCLRPRGVMHISTSLCSPPFFCLNLTSRFLQNGWVTSEPEADKKAKKPAQHTNQGEKPKKKKNEPLNAYAALGRR